MEKEDSNGADEAEPSEHVHSAFSSLDTGITEILSAVSYINKAIWSWYQDTHPLIQIIFSVAIGLVAKPLILPLVTGIYEFFFNSQVVASGLRLQTFPLPVGITLYILFILWVSTYMSAFSRIDALQEKVESLESDIENEP